jgi:hypothetical protein
MKFKTGYIAVFLCLAGLAMAQGYTEWQQGALEGLNYGFKMGQAYANAANGVNITGFNAEVDIYNAWVRQNFGENPNLLMTKMNTPADLSKPVLVANTTSGSGIVHEIDGGVGDGPTYTTNDMNLLPGTTATKLGTYQDGTPIGGEYLGGV